MNPIKVQFLLHMAILENSYCSFGPFLLQTENVVYISGKRPCELKYEEVQRKKQVCYTFISREITHQWVCLKGDNFLTEQAFLFHLTHFFHCKVFL